jgi:hypothetical protein
VTDTNDAVLRVSQSEEGWSIIARQRVRAIAVGRLPTAEDYHAALVQCLQDKAAEIRRLRLTDAERFVLKEVMRSLADTDDVVATEQAAVIDWLLERTA